MKAPSSEQAVVFWRRRSRIEALSLSRSAPGLLISDRSCNARVAGKAVFGFLPVVGLGQELIERAPGCDGQANPVDRRQKQYPRFSKQASLCQPDQADHHSGQIAGRDGREIKFDKGFCEERCHAVVEQAHHGTNQNFADQQRVGERSQDIAANKDVEREESAGSGITPQLPR